MKKKILFFTAGLLLLTASGCNEAVRTEPTQTYTLSESEPEYAVKRTTYSSDGETLEWHTEIFDKNDNILSSESWYGGESTYKTIYEYDTAGYLRKETDPDTNDYYIYEYNEKGLHNKSFGYENNALTSVYISCYDEMGGFTGSESIGLGENEYTVTSDTYENEYNEDGLLSTVKVYDEGTLKETYTYEYDENGNNISYTEQKADLSQTKEYLYTYDENGNMTKKSFRRSDENGNIEIESQWSYEYNSENRVTQYNFHSIHGGEEESSNTIYEYVFF